MNVAEEFSNQAVLRLARRLSRALEDVNFCGWDPYDALSSPFIGAAARTPLVRRAAIQILKRSPINLRPAVRVPRQRHTKALALCISAYARLAALPGGDHYRRLAVSLGRELSARGVARGPGIAWGYDFDVQTRWGYYRAGEPNAVVTAFAAHALLDAHTLAPDAGFDEIAFSAAKFALEMLLVERAGRSFFAYYHGSRAMIHNANMLIASVVDRCSRESAGPTAARNAVLFTLECQRPDGAWPYGEDKRLAWIDGYHTAYILVSLDRYVVRWPKDETAMALDRGIEFYMYRMFESSGAPRATLDALYPVDIHGASSAIWALATLRNRCPGAEMLARRVLAWTLSNMQRADGRYAFQLHARFRNSVSYVRWSDAHMLLALASLADEDDGN